MIHYERIFYILCDSGLKRCLTLTKYVLTPPHEILEYATYYFIKKQQNCVAIKAPA